MSKARGTLNPLTIVGIVVATLGVAGTLAAVGALSDREGLVQESSNDGSIELLMPWNRDDDEPEGTNDPAADDGELHDARTEVEAYSFEEGAWTKSNTGHSDAYGCDVDCQLMVSYPKLKGEGEHIKAANKLLRATAMQTVRTYYEDVSAETAERVKGIAQNKLFGVPEGSPIPLYSTVSYAVTYNNEHFISVCFSDEYNIGTTQMGFIELRTVNFNLDTGESYELSDVLRVTKRMATSFVDNMVQTSGDDADGDGTIYDDECVTLRIAGRAAFEEALRGKGELADQMRTCFFVDGNGKVNLGATYAVSGDEGMVHGWWDVTLTDRQIASGRKESSFWELIGQ